MDKFFIVMSDERHLSATYRHTSLQSAMTEASRLASEHKGRFLILECLGAFQPAKPPVDWIEATEKQRADPDDENMAAQIDLHGDVSSGSDEKIPF